MFKITQGRGFQITFDNGLVLSTQFGYSHYCSVKDYMKEEEYGDFHESPNAEVAVFFKDNGDWCTKEIMELAGLEDPGDDVVGHVSVADWTKIVEAIAKY